MTVRATGTKNYVVHCRHIGSTYKPMSLNSLDILKHCACVKTNNSEYLEVINAPRRVNPSSLVQDLIGSIHISHTRVYSHHNVKYERLPLINTITVYYI